MSHARNVWVAIALEALRNHLGWSRRDVATYCGGDVVRMSIHGTAILPIR